MNPIIKWVGGKRRLVPQLLKLLPADVNSRRHVEPFAGGAALFFAREPVGQPLLSDVNVYLIETYRVIRENPDRIRLRGLFNLYLDSSDRQAYYLRARDVYNRDPDPDMFLFLNRTCFNGLYRTNKAGQFNVPHGRYKNPQPPSFLELDSASVVLRLAALRYGTFEGVTCGPGDFVYCDPPYDGTFTGYASGGFYAEDQARLAEWANHRADSGAAVMVSNADTPLIRQLYEGWQVHEVTASRTVAAKGTSRKPVGELVMTSYKV